MAFNRDVIKFVNLDNVYLSKNEFGKHYNRIRKVVNRNANALIFMGLGGLMTLWIISGMKKEIASLEQRVNELSGCHDEKSDDETV